jgi:hypothetical protein
MNVLKYALAGDARTRTGRASPTWTFLSTCCFTCSFLSRRSLPCAAAAAHGDSIVYLWYILQYESIICRDDVIFGIERRKDLYCFLRIDVFKLTRSKRHYNYTNMNVCYFVLLWHVKVVPPPRE